MGQEEYETMEEFNACNPRRPVPDPIEQAEPDVEDRRILRLLLNTQTAITNLLREWQGGRLPEVVRDDKVYYFDTHSGRLALNDAHRFISLTVGKYLTSRPVTLAALAPVEGGAS